MRLMARAVLIVLAAAIALAHAAATAAAGDSPPFWGQLEPGPFAVGFRSLWQLDYSRRYNIVFDDKTSYATGKAPKPILVNMWYPAEASPDAPPISHRGYLKIETEDPRLAHFAVKLIEYERAIVCKEWTGKTATELSDAERRRLEHAWDSPTASRRNAPALDGRFPLVIYHSGARSSYEDNAVLCEYLASHGYLVIGSSFTEPTGRSLEVDGRQGSARDLQFLIGYARRMHNVDWNSIGLVGHSLGAQAILLYSAEQGAPVDAVVSLDSTLDYNGIAGSHRDDFARSLLTEPKNCKSPLLLAAASGAVFELADSLKHAERLYFTLAEQKHDDFIDQGIVRRQLDCAARPDDVDLRRGLERARAGYEALCRCTLAFFNVYLKHHADARSDLLAKYAATTLGGPLPHVEYLPAGVDGPPAFRDDSNEPPSPRQVRPLLTNRGVTPMVELLKAWHDKVPLAPIFDGDYGFALVDDYLDAGRTANAIAINRLYISFDKSFSGRFVRRGDAFRRHGINRPALDYYNKALALDPSNGEAALRKKSLENTRKN